MKTLIALTLAAAVAGAAGSIVSSFLTPCTNGALGIDYYGGYLYHANGASNPQTIWITTTMGRVVGSIFNAPYTGGNDLCHNGAEIWTCTDPGNRVYRLTTNGSFISSFMAAVGSGGRYGVEYLAGYVYLGVSSTPGRIYKLTTSGSIVTSFQTPGATCAGIDAEGDNLWVAELNTYPSSLFKITTAGSLIASIPQYGYAPRGVACDGTYMWYTNALNHWVYRITMDHTAVAPASLGRVKAVYR